MASPLALASGAVVLHGVLRDTRPGGVELAVDLGIAAGARAGTFRPDAGRAHRIWLTTINHDPALVGRPFAGAIEVRLLDPEGRAPLARRYSARAGLAHPMPSNMQWTELARLEQLAPGRWRLEAAVVEADPDFAGVRSSVLIRPVRPDPGMGGLVSYAFLLPAVGFGALALGLAIGIRARGGPSWPLAASLLVPLAAWALLVA